jgi:glutaminase
VASYIPELKNIDPNKLGINLITVNNKNYSLGDSDEKFSVQNISKVLALKMAFKLDDSKLWERIGVGPLCVFYDEAGKFAFKVGLPGKSGVGGGIIAIHPGEFSIAVWSSRLNKKGNSYVKELKPLSI